MSACVTSPAGRQDAIDGGSFGLWDGVERIAVTMTYHHLDREQLVVWRTVACQKRALVSRLLLIIIQWDYFTDFTHKTVMSVRDTIKYSYATKHM